MVLLLMPDNWTSPFLTTDWKLYHSSVEPCEDQLLEFT